MSVHSQSIVISTIAAQRHPGVDVAQAITPLAEVPIISAIEAGDDWELLQDHPLPPEVIGLACYELKSPCADLFRKSIVPNGYYVVRDAETMGRITRIAQELKLTLVQKGFLEEGAEMNKLASTLAQWRGILEGHGSSDVFQWDTKHWALAILGGLGVGTFVFGVCVSLGHDLYAITKPAVIHGGMWLVRKIADLVKRDPPPPSAGAAVTATGASDIVVADLPDTGESDARESFVSLEEAHVAAQIAAALAVVGAAQFITAPVTAPTVSAAHVFKLLPRLAPVF